MDGKKFIDNVSFEYSNIDNLNIKDVIRCCEDYNLAVIKNFISVDEMNHSKKKIKQIFSINSDSIRQDNEYHKVAENYQRLCVGYGTSPGTGEIRNSRLMRVLYNPIFKENIFDLHDVYRRMIVFRNRLYGVKDNFCLNEPEAGVFSCSRIHQFPKGGGFLALHKDRDGIRTSNNADLKTFLHPLLIMDQKGNVVGVAVANYGKKLGVESFNFGIKSSTLKKFASANGLKFLPPNNRDLSNKDLGQLITEATIYLECHMTIAKIKKIIAEGENKKAFFSEFK